MKNAEFDIETLPVKINYHRETQRDNWNCDQWSVAIKNKNGITEYTDYFTGLGHRNKKYNKPQKPKIVDVLSSLVLDAQAGDESFSNWCDNFGYDSDSISAFSTYQACENTAKMLRRCFDAETMKKIKEITQDM